MVAATMPTQPYLSGLPSPPVSAFRKRMRRSLGSWVIFGVPLFLLAVFAWQVAASNLHTDVAARDAVGISRVSLEADPVGSRIDMVLVDRVGQQTTVTGDINIQLREPDGTVWQSTRSISPADFVLLRGRRSCWPGGWATRWSFPRLIGCARRGVAAPRPCRSASRRLTAPRSRRWPRSAFRSGLTEVIASSRRARVCSGAPNVRLITFV